MAHSRFAHWGKLMYKRDNPQPSVAVKNLLLWVAPPNDPPEAGDGFWVTRFAASARGRGENPVEALSCFLDLIYVYLVEGYAAEYCPTYESYLLMIIGAVDGLDGMEFTLRPERADGDFHMFYWGTSPESDSLAHVYDEDYAWQHGGEGYSHPAIRRDVYDYYRQAYEHHRDSKLLSNVGD